MYISTPVKTYLCLFLGIIFLGNMNASAAKPILYDLKCEHLTNPIGTDVLIPRFSWKINSSDNGVMQTAYEIRVSSEIGKLKNADVWKSGKVTTDASIFVPYNGNALQAKNRYYWQVRVWDNKGNVSDWSEAQFWEMGLLKRENWKAKWIQQAEEKTVQSAPSPLFRKTFEVGKTIKKARLYITSHGLYEAYINGERLGDAHFTPGWTSYHKRLQYQIYDVSEQVKKGNNAIGVMLGDGWFSGNLMGGHHFYGKDLALLAQLEITYTDGSQLIVSTDDTWKNTTNGPIRTSDLYNGETYDANMELHNWATPEFADANWKPARSNASLGFDHLVTSPAPPVLAHERLKPIKIFTTPKGEKVIDFGQNLVGWIDFKTSAKAGDSLVFYHAEVLDKQGNFYTNNLRSAKQRLVYKFKGDKSESYHPHFSFQGFRYVKVEGAKENIDLTNIEAVVLHTAMPQTGHFETSDTLINQLQHNILWGQKGNFLDVPTDCPQRDERLGWTGDAQAFFNTAAFNMDVSGFFAKWMVDVKLDQFDNGAIPHVVPYYWRDKQGGSAGWADVATIIPWNFYQLYGDKRILEDQYESMAKWVKFMADNSTKDLWNKGFHFGDWLFYTPADDVDGRAAVTDKYLIAQAFFGHSVQLMINAASILGKDADVKKYEDLLQKVKTAFVNEYVTESGRLVSGTQTAYVLALQFDMLPEELRPQAAQRLADNINSYQQHLTTGFLGTPYLCHVLSRFGHEDLAYALLMQKTYPSWLYPVSKGATTIWERWDGIKQDGSFQNEHMNSFNHYAYGAIGEWMYQQIGGIQPSVNAPGYKEFIIAPKPGGGLTFANTAFESAYGKIVSNWKIDAGKMTLEVHVPSNTTAKIQFPEGATEVKDATGNTVSETQLSVNSGKYSYTFNLAQ
ncbi:alpha-L-rhamnosidase [Sphingobacterium sp. KB22]|uniref:alpha-L-rhamnosidase n=2 Tax=Sphingobacterium hungaricum TaxID=2082723 RepID=A0A928UX18_9SPHI|nr:alpha-L-rhamnosidase [Sphingobacterium hungaricum]